MTEDILAKNLASGDAVKFPRLGWLTLVRIAGVNSWSVSFICSDGKKHTLEAGRKVTCRRATDEPFARAGEIERRDKQTGRVSLTSPDFLYRFDDLSEIAMPAGRVTGTREFYLRRDLRSGRIIETSRAIYAMPVAEDELHAA